MSNNLIETHIQNKETSILYNFILDILENDANINIDKAVLYLLDAEFEEKIIFYESLPDICTKMQEPLIIVEKLNNVLLQNTIFSFYVAYSLYLLQTSLDIDIPNFYRNFYNVINAENIRIYRHKFYSFTKLILFSDGLSVNIVKTYIKKLCRIAVNIESYICLEILNLVFVIMKLHPMSFVMCNENGYIDKSTDEITYDSFQPYLYELDILSCGIQSIRKIVNTIRNESYKKRKNMTEKQLLNKK